jgi:hypothetical protein
MTKQYKGKSNGYIYKTIFADGNGALLEREVDSMRIWWTNFEIVASLVNYTPPVVKTFTRYFSSSEYSDDGFSSATVLFDGCVGKVKFTVTDGKLTKAEIVE